MARHKNADWPLPAYLTSWDQAAVAVLMDVRDELQRMNTILGCSNTVAIPHILRSIDANTKKPKRRRKKR